jgi:predicted phosphoadenosine phosphosulfate sulfurtransferase
MKIFLKENVFEAALNRMRLLFDEFENIVVNVSGGKDSTVVWELALIVAREKNRLPLKTMWLDQEAEWQSTVDQIKYHMYHTDVDPYWFQIPLRLFNATSAEEHWLHCWDQEAKDKWIHPYDPISIKENNYGTDRFTQLFKQIQLKDWGDLKTAVLTGIRAEESPGRRMGLTSRAKYKWITWGARVLSDNTNHMVFHPIYDWSYTDVWKSIHENGWVYNKLYDAQFRYGIPIQRMRVSNVHHETAVNSLFYLQEVEPEVWERLTKRIAGIDMAGKMGWDDYFVGKLPFMFSGWKEYRDYLLEKLILDEQWKTDFKNRFESMDRRLGPYMVEDRYRAQVQSILVNDWEGIKLRNFMGHPYVAGAIEKYTQEIANTAKEKVLHE